MCMYIYICILVFTTKILNYIASYIQIKTTQSLLFIMIATVNRERFSGLSFHIFHGFQEYRESFSMNVSASL